MELGFKPRVASLLSVRYVVLLLDAPASISRTNQMKHNNVGFNFLFPYQIHVDIQEKIQPLGIFHLMNFMLFFKIPISLQEHRI